MLFRKQQYLASFSVVVAKIDIAELFFFSDAFER
jgi:hypothetical protein